MLLQPTSWAARPGWALRDAVCMALLFHGKLAVFLLFICQQDFQRICSQIWSECGRLGWSPLLETWMSECVRFNPRVCENQCKVAYQVNFSLCGRRDYHSPFVCCALRNWKHFNPLLQPFGTKYPWKFLGKLQLFHSPLGGGRRVHSFLKSCLSWSPSQLGEWVLL